MYRNFHSRRLKDHASYEISDTRMSTVRNQNKASENDLSNRMVIMIYIKTILLIHVMVTIMGYKEEFNLNKNNNFTSV